MFGLSQRPIVWIYMSEVMNDKGMSFGTLVNLVFTCLMSIVVPFAIELGSFIFYLFGGSTLVVKN